MGDDAMQSGEEMISKNDQFAFKLQSDGNLVLSHCSDVLWASDTNGKGRAPFKLKLQNHDNHLVLYDADSKAIWATGVYKGKDGKQWKEGGYTRLTNDGNFAVYDGDNNIMWSTGTKGGLEKWNGNESNKVWSTLGPIFG